MKLRLASAPLLALLAACNAPAPGSAAAPAATNVVTASTAAAPAEPTMPAAAATPAAASGATQASSYTAAAPLCTAGDTRTHIPVWTPDVNDRGTLSSEPPSQNGRTYFIQFTADRDEAGEDCFNPAPDNLFNFSYPNRNGVPGGLQIAIQGNAKADNGGACRFSGFYINEHVPGMHQGWITTSYKAIAQEKIATSDKFCIEK